jgi:hypothetical protein
MIWSKPVKHRLNRGSAERQYACGLGANDLAHVQFNRIYPCCSAFAASLEMFKAWRLDPKNKELRQQEKNIFEAEENATHEMVKQKGFGEWRKQLEDQGVDLSLTPKE